MHGREDARLVVRLDLLERVGRADVLAADHHRQVHLLAAHLGDLPANLLALGRARCVVVHRLVARRRRGGDRGSAHGRRFYGGAGGPGWGGWGGGGGGGGGG